MTHTHRRNGVLALTAVAVALSATPLAYASTSININFNDSTALYWLYGQARSTFAVPSSDGGGYAVSCSGGEAAGCWEYAQPTYDAANNFYWFYVYDWNSTTGTGASHYHLLFEDWSIGTCFYDPHDGLGAGFGRSVNGTCQGVDWTTSNRYLSTHQMDDWIQTWPDAWRQFKPSAMVNYSSVPIQIWVLATDGNWYFADNLTGPGAKQNLYNIANNQPAWEVDVGVASSYSGGSPFEIDNFYIQYP